MTRYQTVSWICLLAGFAALPVASGCVVVAGDQVTAGELAAAVPEFGKINPDEAILTTPAAGVARQLGQADLVQLGRAHELSISWRGAVCIERKAEPLTLETVREALDRGLATLELGGDAVTMSVADFDRRPMPAGALVFSASGLAPAGGESPGATHIWRGVFTYAKNRSIPFRAMVRLSRRARCVVLAGDEATGTVLDEAKLRVAEQELPIAGPKCVNDVSVVMGSKLKRRMQSGAFLTRTDVDLPLEVERGDVVSVLVRSGGAQIRTDAKALTDGSRGGTVILEHGASRKRIRATVSGKREAQILMGERDAS